MAEFPPEDLGQEIDRLWAKVGSSASAPWDPVADSPASEPVSSRQVAWETMALLKKQHGRETAYWAELIEAKERAARAAAERLSYLELEVNRLREKSRADEARFLAEGVEFQGKAEVAGKALQEERAAHEKEREALRGLLGQIRERMTNESAGFRRERETWDKKEQQYLSDLKDLQALSQRREAEIGKAADDNRALHQNLKEAKNALEKTLSELLRERQVGEESERERQKALKKVDEVQRHFDELSKIWEEERAQWRELWDRERSTWESQRGEFAAWEENVRKERTAWLSEVKAKEEDQARYSAQIGESLRQSSEATARLSGVMNTLARTEAATKRFPVWLRRTALAVALCVAAAVPAWRWHSRYHFSLKSARSVDLNNPTSLGYDGNFLWVTEWDGRFVAYDPKDLSAPARKTKAAGSGAYRPVASAFGAGNLWTLDAAQARVVRHDADDPSRLLASRPAPGAAPTALAFDGRALWSYDAANKSLYRHAQDEASATPFALGEDLVVTAMAWVSGRLWVVDAKTRELWVFDFQLEKFSLNARYALADGILGLAPAGDRTVWILTGPGADKPGHALSQYAY